MIAECPHCNANVQTALIGETEFIEPENPAERTKTLLVVCSTCDRPMVLCAEYGQDFDGWDYYAPSRVWPDPPRGFAESIPYEISNALREASICLKAQVNLACAVMCGRALEGICAHLLGEEWKRLRTIEKGLKALQEKGFIDSRLYEWGEALREKRNIGAHMGEGHVSLFDAKDCLDFAVAICEYVFVLAQKFAEFKKRQEYAKSKPKFGELTVTKNEKDPPPSE